MSKYENLGTAGVVVATLLIVVQALLALGIPFLVVWALLTYVGAC